MAQHANAEAAGARNAAYGGVLRAILLHHAHREPRYLLAPAVMVDNPGHCLSIAQHR
jgi:hypothetical protein